MVARVRVVLQHFDILHCAGCTTEQYYCTKTPRPASSLAGYPILDNSTAQIGIGQTFLGAADGVAQCGIVQSRTVREPGKRFGLECPQARPHVYRSLQMPYGTQYKHSPPTSKKTRDFNMPSTTSNRMHRSILSQSWRGVLATHIDLVSPALYPWKVIVVQYCVESRVYADVTNPSRLARQTWCGTWGGQWEPGLELRLVCHM